MVQVPRLDTKDKPRSHINHVYIVFLSLIFSLYEDFCWLDSLILGMFFYFHRHAFVFAAQIPYSQGFLWRYRHLRRDWSQFCACIGRIFCRQPEKSVKKLRPPLPNAAHWIYWFWLSQTEAKHSVKQVPFRFWGRLESVYTCCVASLHVWSLDECCVAFRALQGAAACRSCSQGAEGLQKAYALGGCGARGGIRCHAVTVPSGVFVLK